MYRTRELPMRILIAIPHFFSGVDPGSHNRSQRPEARDERARALVAVIAGLQQNFGHGIYGLDHCHRVAWQHSPSAGCELDIVVCTTGQSHLLDTVPALRPLYRHRETSVAGPMLGFECHRVLGEARGRYDYYGYLEDDIVVRDPLFFKKRSLFDRTFGPAALLQPNRFEVRIDGPVQKLYVDYDLHPVRTERYQNIREEPRLCLPFLDDTVVFERTSYPSSGCFFLNDEQLGAWVRSPYFLDGDVSYMSPLDSAAALSIMQTFRVYKSVLDQAWFLEVVHVSPRWILSVTRDVRLASREQPLAPRPSAAMRP
jgi:hypothetical protein